MVGKLASLRLLATGRVQGVGFRPTVARLAAASQLTGFVENTSDGVWLEVEGDAARVQDFPRQLRAALPSLARLTELHVEPQPLQGYDRFEIRLARGAGPLRTLVPADVRVCEDCLADVSGESPSRGAYEFVSCTNCGPRYSILERLPYERAQTGMRAFPLCTRCAAEYADPGDRRFHAQTNACRDCGPALSRPHDGPDDGPSATRASSPLLAARRALAEGRIVALQGLGGFQLLVDARQSAAVQRLRERKRRPAKPLAVLVEDLAEAARWAQLSDQERAMLSGPEGPIVLAAARATAPLAAEVHPGLREVGLLLPTTPLHALLIRGLGPLVATSGNGDGDPLEYDASAATARAIADVVVTHNRPIVRPVDDSVVRFQAGRPVTLRLARGLAPLACDLSSLPQAWWGKVRQAEQLAVLALGGHQKAAFAYWNGVQAALGPHIGDLDHAATRQRYCEQLHGFQNLYGGRPRLVVHDLHPEYYTTLLAERGDACPGVAGPPPILLPVQHHHAHVVATQLEEGWLDRTVLGLAWDGTGYGTDGTIWGGEVLEATAHGFRRWGHVRPFRLPGGEQAIREPWRVALSLLLATLEDDSAAVTALGLPVPAERLLPLLQRGTASPWTTSMGRLFDAVATLVLPPEESRHGQAQYEGELALRLEAAASGDQDAESWAPYSFPWVPTPEGTGEWDWRPLLVELLADRARGVTPERLARRFHVTLAQAAWDVAQLFPQLPVVLGGGVFQNRVLVEMIEARFRRAGRALGRPGVVPPNDGGLAAGQLVIGLAAAERLGLADAGPTGGC